MSQLQVTVAVLCTTHHTPLNNYHSSNSSHNLIQNHSHYAVLSLHLKLATMKLSAAIITLLAGSAAAFAPAMSSAAMRTSSQQTTAIYAEPKEEEGGLDLDLDEMFSMYVTFRIYHCASIVSFVCLLCKAIDR